MIGLGSIGRRHVRNLVKIFESRKREYQIDALRSGHTELQADVKEIICNQYYNFEDLPDNYDVIFITNPTQLHYDTIKKVILKTKHMFIEKPVFDSLNYKWKALPLKDEGVYYVACPLRHKSIIKYVKQKILAEEKTISVRIISTSYLPAWRKNVDYRSVYSAKKIMGGGVTRDLIHEWDYALYLFGYPDKVFHVQRHVSDLEIDSDDLSIYMAEYPNMVLEMHLDYVGHKTERILQIFTNERRIDIDLAADIIYEYAYGKLIKKQEFPYEDFYINELEYFWNCTENKVRNINTIEDAYNTLKIALVGE